MSNLGQALNKTKQRTITGGKVFCVTDADCRNNQTHVS